MSSSSDWSTDWSVKVAPYNPLSSPPAQVQPPSEKLQVSVSAAYAAAMDEAKICLLSESVYIPPDVNQKIWDKAFAKYQQKLSSNASESDFAIYVLENRKKLKSASFTPIFSSRNWQILTQC